MYAGLRLAKTVVCCCPDQLNKRLTDSKIESVRRKLCSVRAKSTFVIASSQSQRVAFMTRSATEERVPCNDGSNFLEHIVEMLGGQP